MCGTKTKISLVDLVLITFSCLTCSFFPLFMKQISKKDRQIKTLQGELQAHKTEEERMLIPQDQQSHPNVKASQVKQAGLQQVIDQLKVQLNSLMLENKQAETSLQQVSSAHPTPFTFQWL